MGKKTKGKALAKPALSSTALVGIVMTLVIVAVAGAVALQAKQEAAKPRPIALITGDNPHIIGPADADLILTEFADYNCSHCYEFSKVLPELMRIFDGRIQYVYRHFPLQGENGVTFTYAMAAEAAAAQGKFWEFQELLWENYGQNSPDRLRGYAAQVGLDLDRFDFDMTNSTYRDRVLRDLSAASELGLMGTPAFFFNGEVYPDSYRLEIIQAAIADKLGIEL